MHGQPGLHVRIGNCTPRGIWVCKAAKWETPEQLGLHSQRTNISTLRRKWKQGGGGAEGEGYTDSSFTQNISPPRIVWKIREVNASCLMENKGSNLKPSASNTCTLSLHLCVSVSCLILKHNPFGAPTCHNISIRPPSPHSGQFQVGAGWNVLLQQVRQSAENWSLHFDSVQKKIYRERDGGRERKGGLTDHFKSFLRRLQLLVLTSAGSESNNKAQTPEIKSLLHCSTVFITHTTEASVWILRLYAALYTVVLHLMLDFMEKIWWFSSYFSWDSFLYPVFPLIQLQDLKVEGAACLSLCLFNICFMSEDRCNVTTAFTA